MKTATGLVELHSRHMETADLLPQRLLPLATAPLPPHTAAAAAAAAQALQPAPSSRYTPSRHARVFCANYAARAAGRLAQSARPTAARPSAPRFARWQLP